MTTEEIKKIVDDERAEQLTALLCRHWEVATQRLDTFQSELLCLQYEKLPLSANGA